MSHLFADCALAFRRSYKHYTNVVMDTATVDDFDECVYECKRTGICASFSYSERRSRDNCLTSQLGVEDIKSYSDLVADSDWDVFEYDLRRRECRGEGNGGDEGKERGGLTF